MIDDELDPALAAELMGLHEGLQSWLGEDLTPDLIQMLYDYIEDHRTNARKKGIDFPKMIALVVPRLGWIKLIRYELNEFAIRRAVFSLIKECPSVTREEIQRAVRRAWPHVALSAVIDEAEIKIARGSTNALV